MKKTVWVGLTAFALAACGGSPKQADDASSQAAKTDDEGAPKWDSSSSTTTPSSSSGSSTGSSGSSSSAGDTAASGASPNGSSAATGSTDTSPAPAAGPSSGPHNEAEIALKRAARQVKANCGAATDADGKALGPFGKTTVSIVLGRNGHSKNVTLDSSYDGKPAGNCIMQAFKNLTYAPWAGADASTTWEVELVQPK